MRARTKRTGEKRRRNDAAILDDSVARAFDTSKLREAIRELDAAVELLESAPDLVLLTRTVCTGVMRPGADSSPTARRGSSAKPRSGGWTPADGVDAVAAITGAVRWRLERVRRVLLRRSVAAAASDEL